jgi:hypothetical protein
MSLKILILEDEPELEVSHVPLSGTDNHADDADMELPGEFLVQDDLDVLDDAACALEQMGVKMACEGISLDMARELDKLDPGFLKRAGGHAVFTHRPSLEGLNDGVKAVVDTLKAIVIKVRTFVAELYKRFLSWLTARFSKPGATDLDENLQQFVAERRNKDAIAYITSLPDDPAEAADEVARWIDGDSKAYASALADQFGGLHASVERLEDQMHQNPVHFRLAKGIVSVKELFKQDSDSAIAQILFKAHKAADVAMKTRRSEEFYQAIEGIDGIAHELDAFEKNMTINDHESSEMGDDKAVPFSQLYDNVAQAANDFKRVDVQQLVQEMASGVKHVIQMSAETKIEDILEMIPEDVPADKQGTYAQKIAALYRRLAKLGADILRLWKVRSDAVGSINEVGKALMGLVDAFEKAVTDAGSGLSQEQKAQLVKALGGKGFQIAF